MEHLFVKLYLHILSRRDISSTAKIVYGYLDNRIGDNGECWPGQRKIAKDCGMAPKAINRAVRELKSKELIDIIPGKLDGPVTERTCRYRLRNVCESNTLADVERVRNEHVNVVETNTSTCANRTQNKNQEKKQEKNQGGKVKKATATYNPLSVDLPLILNNDGFRKLWSEFCQHRAEIKKKLTPLAVTKLINKLERWGLQRATAAIEYSIANGWIGIFEECANAKQPDTSKQRKTWGCDEDIVVKRLN